MNLRFVSVLAALALPIAANAEDGWTFGEDADAYDTVMMLSQAAGNTIKDEYATKDVTPVLALRCQPGNPAPGVTIDWMRFISSFNTEVGFKVDGGKTLWQKWGVDNSNKITDAKSESDISALIDAMSAGSTLSVEIAPYSEPPVTVTFDLEGFADGLEELKAACE